MYQCSLYTGQPLASLTVNVVFDSPLSKTVYVEMVKQTRKFVQISFTQAGYNVLVECVQMDLSNQDRQQNQTMDVFVARDASYNDVISSLNFLR